MSNITIPAGAKNHGDPNLLCLPPTWTDYFIFYGTNYFAHVGTLVERPGQTLPETLINSANALFVPAAGAVHALRLLILRSTTKRGNPLRHAAKAGALCMLVSKSDLRYLLHRSSTLHDSWLTRNFTLAGREPEFIPKRSDILGRCKYNRDEYALVPVPPDVPLRAYGAVVPGDKPFKDPRKIEIPPSYEVARMLIALFQVIWGIVSLYQARANQIELYGYGAFGLTAVPYAVMSFINLVTNLIRPGYPNMYLIHTPDMDEAMEIGGRFAGIVAAVDLELLEVAEERVELVFDIWANPRMRYPYIGGYLVIGLIPILVVAGMTGFRAGSDIRIERAWILAWFIVGAVAPIYMGAFTNSVLAGRRLRGRETISTVILALPLWVPAIGGMVIVGKMLASFGICARM